MNARGERGQTIVITVLLATALLGFAALVVDTGTWFRARRHTQAIADAAALAAAQALPSDTTQARTLASQYVTSNGGNAQTAQISIDTTYRTNDTASVTVHEPAEGFFAKLFGVDLLDVSSTA